MTLTKGHIINDIRSITDLNKAKAERSVEAFLETIKDSLQSGEDVLISGFGKFCVRNKAQWKGRNPRTGDDMMLPPRRVITFQCSPVLRGKINEDG